MQIQKPPRTRSLSALPLARVMTSLKNMAPSRSRRAGFILAAALEYSKSYTGHSSVSPSPSVLLAVLVSTYNGLYFTVRRALVLTDDYPVSSCHGAGGDPIAPDCYPSRFFNWWNSLFPHPASELTNGAIRMTSSEYFAFCSAHHLPDYTDLVIVELDSDDKSHVFFISSMFHTLIIRDLVILEPSITSNCSYDQSFCARTRPPLLYSVISHLRSTNKTALLGQTTGTVSLPSSMMYPTSGAPMSFTSDLYPHVLSPNSSKAALYPSYITSPSSIAKYYADPILANTEGHGVLADMLISYIQSQVCVAWSAARGSGSALPVFYTLGSQAGTSPKDATGLFGGKGLRKGSPVIPDDPDAARPRPPPGHAVGLQVPMSRIGSRPSDLHSLEYEEIAPMCVSANDLVNPLPPSLFHGSGWHAFHPPPTGVPATDSISHYWFSTLPTSRLRVPLIVGAGDVGIYYIREPRAVLASEGSSAIECWVDDNYDGRVIIDNEGDTDSEEAAYVSLFFVCPSLVY